MEYNGIANLKLIIELNKKQIHPKVFNNLLNQVDILHKYMVEIKEMTDDYGINSESYPIWHETKARVEEDRMNKALGINIENDPRRFT